MKKIFLFALLAALSFSCNSDDDGQPIDNGLHNPYTGSVVGTWSTIALAIDGEEINLNCEAEVPAPDNYIFVFNEDNTFELYHNCSLLGEPLGTGTYSTNGNVLTLNMNGMEGKAHMIDLDEYLNIEDEQLIFRFSIGSGNSLFYGYEFAVDAQ
jgi:hypothetical protein